MQVRGDLCNWGVKDVFFVVCDGLKGLPEVVEQAWPQAIVQTCIVHLIRNTFHLASKRDWDALKRDVKPIYTAVNAAAAIHMAAAFQVAGYRHVIGTLWNVRDATAPMVAREVYAKVRTDPENLAVALHEAIRHLKQTVGPLSWPLTST